MHIHACTYTRMHPHTHTYIHIHTRKNAIFCLYTYTHTRAHTITDLHMFTFMHTYIHTHTYPATQNHQTSPSLRTHLKYIHRQTDIPYCRQTKDRQTDRQTDTPVFRYMQRFGLGPNIGGMQDGCHQGVGMLRPLTHHIALYACICTCVHIYGPVCMGCM